MNRKKLASLFKQQAAIAMAIAAELEAADETSEPSQPRGRGRAAKGGREQRIPQSHAVANDAKPADVGSLVEARAAQALRRRGIGL